MVNHRPQLAEGIFLQRPFFWYEEYLFHGQAKLFRLLSGPVNAPLGAVGWAFEFAAIVQSRGDPESRGIMPRNRASITVKSPWRCRMYRRAASSDSAAIQFTCGALSSSSICGGPVNCHSCASHAPDLPGWNRLFLAVVFFSIFLRTAFVQVL